METGGAEFKSTQQLPSTAATVLKTAAVLWGPQGLSGKSTVKSTQ